MNGPEVLLLAEIRHAAMKGETRLARERARLSRAEVAAACGVDQSTVARWESGARSPRGTSGLKYARLIGRLQELSDSSGAAS
jgi:DNA-binding transcriptional regulator YiaG